MEGQAVDPGQLALSAVILIAMLIAWWEMMKFVFKRAREQFRFVKAMRANDKSFKDKYKAMEEMKEKGELHEWTSMPIPGVGDSVTVCRKTGWVPSKEGFYPVENIQHYEKMKEVEEQAKKEYDEFKAVRVKEIVERYGLQNDKMEDLMNDIYSIRKDFHVKKMEEALAQMQTTLKDIADGKGKN